MPFNSGSGIHSLPELNPNDISFQFALITLICLSAKYAILIVEFAKDLQDQGKSVFEASLEAAHLRLRPILMTSLAFILGVVPLYIATGASSASQRAVGTGVLWGMTIGTVLSVFLVPVFYLLVRSLFKGKKNDADHFDDGSSNDQHSHTSEENNKEAVLP